MFCIFLGFNTNIFADTTTTVPDVTYQSQIQNIGWQDVKSSGDTSGTIGQSLRVETFRINLINAPAGAKIKYSAHVQNIGWMDFVYSPNMAGTVNQSLRLEAFKISLENMPGYSVEYKAHVQNIGWQDWVKDGAVAGTTGQDLRVEAIQIKLVKLSNVSSVSLNKSNDTLTAGNTDTLKAAVNPTDAYVTSTNWTSSNTSVATVDNTGKVTAVNAGTATITTTVNGSVTASCNVTVTSPVNVTSVSLNKTTDSLNVGASDTLTANILPDTASKKDVSWTSSNTSIATVDTTGKITGISAGTATITATTADGNKTATCNVTVKSTQADGISVSYQANVKGQGWQNPVSDSEIAGTIDKALPTNGFKIQLLNAPSGARIKYQTQVQYLGWQPLVYDGTESGSGGQDLNVEAIKIYLENMPGYTVEYQAQVQNIGWQNWVSNGAIAGTVGPGLRLEALRIRIVKDIHVQYQAHIENIGWKDAVTDGTIVSTNAKPLAFQALKVNLENAPAGAKVQCTAHVQNIGWMNPVYDGDVVGTTGQSLRLEALKLKLINAPGYRIKYQVDVQGIGWMNWVSDDQIAGTVGLNLRIQGIRIKVYADDGVQTVPSVQPSSTSLNTINYKASEYLRYSSNIQSTNQTAIQLHGGINENNCVYFSSTALRAVGYSVPLSMCNTGQYTNFLLSKGWTKQTNKDLLTPGSVCFTVNDGLDYPTHTYMFLDWVNPDDHTMAYIADNQGNDVHIRSLLDAPGVDAFAYFLHQ
ncbi:Ig-like domain-containing protein [Clostridium felsineum]|uniref:Ig-like domain-containing protein n=1 Tax=Clostridium felsineum TaxID=36839 RepID=UPI0009CA26E6|nr:Ig-like domain-containing protein [Clostridium felsineum]URZ16947.1 hypothetical protein CLFE_029940 [Clostridium felsineum DSM 794]